MLPTYGTPIKSKVPHKAHIGRRHHLTRDWESFDVEVPVGTLGYIKSIHVTNSHEEYRCIMKVKHNGKKFSPLLGYKHTEITADLTNIEAGKVKRPPKSDQFMNNFEVLKVMSGTKTTHNVEEPNA
jgi:hypothetical protein